MADGTERARARGLRPVSIPEALAEPGERDPDPDSVREPLRPRATAPDAYRGLGLEKFYNTELVSHSRLFEVLSGLQRHADDNVRERSNLPSLASAPDPFPALRLPLSHSNVPS